MCHRKHFKSITKGLVYPWKEMLTLKYMLTSGWEWINTWLQNALSPSLSPSFSPPLSLCPLFRLSGSCRQSKATFLQHFTKFIETFKGQRLPLDFQLNRYNTTVVSDTKEDGGIHLLPYVLCNRLWQKQYNFSNTFLQRKTYTLTFYWRL